jgi:hypothetical protein
MASEFIDIQEMIDQEVPGGEFAGLDKAGLVKVKYIDERGTEQVGALDHIGLMKQHGIDPMKVEIKYNDPDTAINENALGFREALSVAMTGNPRQQLKALQVEYGEDNVAQAEDGSLKIRENGVWKKAEADFWTSMGAGAVASGPMIAGGILGAAGGIPGIAAGVGVGKMVQIKLAEAFGLRDTDSSVEDLAKGATRGVYQAAGNMMADAADLVGASDAAKDIRKAASLNSLFGGALSGKVASKTKDEIGPAFGLRDEEDTLLLQQEIGKEIASSLVWGRAFQGAGIASKKAWDKIANKPMIADFIANVTTTSRRAWTTVMRSADDAADVQRGIKSVVDFEAKRANGLTEAGKANPVVERMKHFVSHTMDLFKKSAQQQYDDGLKALSSSGAMDGAKIEAKPFYDSMVQSLSKLGLVKQLDDGTFAFIDRVGKGELNPFARTLDPRSLGTLKETFEMAKLAAGRNGWKPAKLMTSDGREMFKKIATGGTLSFKETHQLVKSLDDLLVSTGAYARNGAQFSEEAHRVLFGARGALRQGMSESLKGKSVKLPNGASQDAQAYFENVAKKYHLFRDNYDQLAVNGIFGGNKSQVRAAVQRLAEEKGEALEEAFVGMAKAVGADPKRYIAPMERLSAANQLSVRYSKKGLAATLTQAPFGGVRGMASKAANITQIQALAKFGDFLNKTPPQTRVQLLENPAALPKILESIYSAPQIEQQMTDELLSGVQ